MQMYTSSSKSYSSRISSNRIIFEVYPVISVEGLQLISEMRNNTHPVIFRETVDARMAIMDTCTGYIRITGGPPHFQTMLYKSPLENSHYKVTK